MVGKSSSNTMSGDERHHLVKRLLLIPALVVGGFFFAAPAGANSVKAVGATVCTNGAHVITWTVINGDKNSPMTFVSATATLNGTTSPVTGFENPTPALGTTTGTTIIPGPQTGTVILHVTAHWVTLTKPTTAAVDLVAPCPTTTTSTTTTSTTTTSTSVPPSTTPTTTVITTTPPGPTCGGPGQLACTGSNDIGVTFIGLSAVLGGSALIALKRRGLV